MTRKELCEGIHQRLHEDGLITLADLEAQYPSVKRGGDHLWRTVEAYEYWLDWREKLKPGQHFQFNNPFWMAFFTRGIEGTGVGVEIESGVHRECWEFYCDLLYYNDELNNDGLDIATANGRRQLWRDSLPFAKETVSKALRAPQSVGIDDVVFGRVNAKVNDWGAWTGHPLPEDADDQREIELTIAAAYASKEWTKRILDSDTFMVPTGAMASKFLSENTTATRNRFASALRSLEGQGVIRCVFRVVQGKGKWLGENGKPLDVQPTETIKKGVRPANLYVWTADPSQEVFVVARTGGWQ